MIKIRRADAKDVVQIARVHVDSWKEAYRGLIDDSFLAELRYESKENLWSTVLQSAEPKQCVFVAEEGAKIVGFASAGPNRSSLPFDAELYAIYLLRTSQGHGLGRKLFEHCVAHLYCHNMRSLVTWVLEGNKASAFYEALGAKIVGEKWEKIGEKAYKELAYGWAQI